MMNRGHAIFLTLSMLGNRSPGMVKRKLKATRNADASGLCSIMPPISTPSLASSSASWHVGPLPSDRPYLRNKKNKTVTARGRLQRRDGYEQNDDGAA